MKVDGPGRPRFSPGEAAVSAKDKSQPKAHEPASEKVQLSSVGKLLAEARSPDAPDAARIERLKGEIESGSFTVDAERIAQAMLDEEL